MRQHQDRGIVAFVTFDSEVYQSEHWSRTPGKLANFADTLIVDWVDPEDRLPVETLKTEVPEVAWDRLQGSGIKVSEESGDRLIELWIAHAEALGRGRPLIPEELDPYDETYPEGTVSRVIVNRYEREPRARAACLKHYGTVCAICGFDFEQHYGEIGEGYIHVHHLKELSSLPDGYRVDPIEDLRPVCPNCHAMLHQQRPAMDLEELRRRLK